MTDTQQINASVLADWLQCVKQMRNSFKAYKATLDADDTKKGFVSMLEIRMEHATPDLDALRALVAEQEQEENEVDPYFQDLAAVTRAKIPAGASLGEMCEAVNGHATQQFAELSKPIYTAPQFEVGDTVRHISGDTGKILGFDWENDISKQVNVLWEPDNEECGCAIRNLTLVSKAVKA